MVAPDRFLSMGQIEQNECQQMSDVELRLLYLKPFNCEQKRAQACLRMLFTNHIYQEDLALNNLQ